MSQKTTDHNFIKQWVEERNGKPAKVKETEDLIRLDFPDAEADPNLEEISWEEFFQAFEKHNLALLYENETNGNTSRFNKLVTR